MPSHPITLPRGLWWPGQLYPHLPALPTVLPGYPLSITLCNEAGACNEPGREISGKQLLCVSPSRYWGVIPKLGQGWSGHTACSPWPRADPSAPASKRPLLFAGADGFGVQIAGSGTMGIVLPTMPLAPCRQALPDYRRSSALSIISCSNPPAVHTAGRAKPNCGAQHSPLPTATRATDFSSPTPHPPAQTLHVRQSSHIHTSAQPSLHQQTCPAQQSVLDGMEIQPLPRGWHCGDSIHTSLHPSKLQRKQSVSMLHCREESHPTANGEIAPRTEPCCCPLSNVGSMEHLSPEAITTMAMHCLECLFLQHKWCQHCQQYQQDQWPHDH